MLTVVESSASADRFAAAADFVWSFPQGTELLLVGATREAVDEFAHRLSAETGASFGWHRFTLLQLAASLAQPHLAERGFVHASPLGNMALVARAIHQTLQAKPRHGAPGLRYLEPVARFPGFARALAATLTELRLADVDADALRVLDEPGPELAVLLASFEQQLRAAKVADRATLFATAVQAARAHTPPVGAPLLLLDVAVDSQAARNLLGAIIDAAPDSLATLPAGDERTRAFFVALGATVSGLSQEERHAVASTRPESPQVADLPEPHRQPASADSAPLPSSLQRLRRYLFDPAVPPAGIPDESVLFFSAPGEQRECIEMVRWMLREAERGVRFDDMAVFLRAPREYCLALEHALQRARIPAYFASGTRRPDPAGRAFVALLQCKADGLSARRFAEYLSLGQVPGGDDGESATGGARTKLSKARGPTPDARRPTPADPPVVAGTLRAPWRWEELLVEAAVIGGRARWRRRLDGLAAQVRERLAEAQEEEPDGTRVAGLQRELEQVDHLSKFALPVIEALDELPAQATWGEWLNALTALAPSVIHKPERILLCLAELQPMEGVGPVTIDEVIAVLADRLLELERDPPAARYGQVFVGSPEDARGRSFRIAFVPGLAEKIFPQRPREDPLLIDALRGRLASSLDTQSSRAERERLQLRLAVGAATERVYISYPRVEVVEGRARVPSFYGLDVERAVTGQVPDFEALEQRTAAVGQARLAWPAPLDPARSIDDIEHDLATMGVLLHQTAGDTRGRARYLLDLNDSLGRSLRARWLRWETKRWTPADGLTHVSEAVRPLLEAQSLRARPYGVSALQRFAACPYQFYLAAMLGLAPRQVPAPLERIDPLTKGRLVHSIQAAVLRALQEGDGLPVTAETVATAMGVLDRVIDEVTARYHDDLAPAIARVWHDEVEALRTDLHVWLERLAVSGSDWDPTYFELGFGLPTNRDLDPHSVREPVRLHGQFLVRGAVDLVERKRDGELLRVTDHKTGADRTPSDFVVAGGSILQPVLYSLAVEAATGTPVNEARLSFCTSAGGFVERVVRIDGPAREIGREVLEIVDREINAGTLVPAPRVERRNGREEIACDLCDFREVCGPHEALRTRRKDPTPLAGLLRLRSLT